MDQKQIFKQLYAYCELKGLKKEYIKNQILSATWNQNYEDTNPLAVHEFCLIVSWRSSIELTDLIEARKPCPWRFS